MHTAPLNERKYPCKLFTGELRTFNIAEGLILQTVEARMVLPLRIPASADSSHAYSYAASQMRRIRRGIETTRPRSGLGAYRRDCADRMDTDNHNANHNIIILIMLILLSATEPLPPPSTLEAQPPHWCSVSQVACWVHHSFRHCLRVTPVVKLVSNHRNF